MNLAQYNPNQAVTTSERCYELCPCNRLLFPYNPSIVVLRLSLPVVRGGIYMCINLDKLERVSFKQTDIQGQLKGERGQTVSSELK